MAQHVVAQGVAIPFALVLYCGLAWAQPVPSGNHPRLFMNPANVSAFKSNAAKSGTAAAELVKACQDTLDNPSDYTTRGGADGDYWPGSAMRCAFAYVATNDSKYLTQALKYWHASLDDDQNIGDGLGCKKGVSTNWQSWSGNPPAPPVILTVTHDTGYPMRWYGPDIALTYDWLNGAPGVDAALLDQTRTCLTAWIDWYSAKGYLSAQAGANYNAGFVVGKTLGAIALGNDGGTDGHLWTETVGNLFPTLLIGKGLAGASGHVGDAAGPMVGGDWAEGWQYGPLSVLEYAVATRALEENGAALPEMDNWTNSLAVRYLYANVPDLSGQWVGGDFDSSEVYASPSLNIVDAVLAGPSSDAAASFAAFIKTTQSLAKGSYFYNALAELRNIAPVDFRAQNPAPTRWYIARGTRAVYARSSWAPDAFWAVFSSAPAVVPDHIHFSASNFVFSRGADHLVVDASNYGEPSTLATNAVTADSTVAQGDYAPSQTPWSEAELVWARGTDDAVYAARSDFAKAFIFSSTSSDIRYAHREWVMLPEGEVVAIDRVHTAGAAQVMYVGFHTNTGGSGLRLNGNSASGTVGGSKLTIHAISLSGGTPVVSHPEVGDCSLSCSYPCGKCDAARFAVDKYSVNVPGPWAVAIHVLDGVAANEADAVVGSLNDDTTDPAPKQNVGVIGAAIFRGSKQSYVVASSATDGTSPATMTYGVPGTSASRHVVFDAPEDTNGASNVNAVVSSGRCVITITAGTGFAGRPLMFSVATATDGCTPTEGTNVAPGAPPVGGGTGAGGSSAVGNKASASKNNGGCGCRVSLFSNRTDAFAPWVLLLAVIVRGRRRLMVAPTSQRDWRCRWRRHLPKIER